MMSLKNFFKEKGLCRLHQLQSLSESERNALEFEVGEETGFALRAIFRAADQAEVSERSSEESYALILRNNEVANLNSELEEAAAVSVPFDSLLIQPHDAPVLDEDEITDKLTAIIQGYRANDALWITLIGSSVDFDAGRVELWFADAPSVQQVQTMIELIRARCVELRHFEFIARTKMGMRELVLITAIHELYRHDTVLGLRAGSTLLASTLNDNGRNTTGVGTTTCVVQVVAGSEVITGVLTAAHCAPRSAVALTQYAPGFRSVHGTRESMNVPVLGTVTKESKNGGTPWTVDIAFLRSDKLPSPEPNTFRNVSFFGFEGNHPTTEVRSGTIGGFCSLTIGGTVREYKAKQVFVMGQKRCCFGELDRKFTDFSSNSQVFICTFPSTVDSGDSGAPVMAATKTEGKYVLIGVLSMKVTGLSQSETFPGREQTGHGFERCENTKEVEQQQEGKKIQQEGALPHVVEQQQEEKKIQQEGAPPHVVEQQQESGEKSSAQPHMKKESFQRADVGEYVVVPVQYLGVNVKLFSGGK